MKRGGASPAPPAVTGSTGGVSCRVGPCEAVAFHRVLGGDETWSVVAGGPLELHLIHADGRYELRVLSLDPDAVGGSTTTVEAGSLRAARLARGGRRALLRRAAAPGHRSGVREVPDPAEILRRHPLHRAVIRDLSPA